ncbi:MAG: hypothetical protein CMO49_03030 [Verrucomicrobiales bacterium]|nr:hypothetical protein [Verrucomicrobiales bacterium]
MASKDYWIDPEELSKLGQELASENSDFEIKDSDINSLEGVAPPTKYTSNEESIANENNFDITKIQTQLAEIKKRAQKSGIISSQKNDNNIIQNSIKNNHLSNRISGNSLVSRLSSFVSWAYSQESLTGIFIADPSGKELIESGADPVVVNSGVEIAQPFFEQIDEHSYELIGPIGSKNQARDWEGSDMTLFVTNSMYGLHILGVLSQYPLNEDELSNYREGFSLVMDIK